MAATAAALALAAIPFITTTAHAAPGHTVKAAAAASVTPAQALAFVQANMTAANQVNSLPHINTMTRAMNVNVYQVTPGVFAYTSSMAIDTDGSDPNPDPDHQSTTTFQDSNGAQLGAAHVPYYVLGDDCFDKVSPCPHFFYPEHNIAGRQFALIFYNGQVIGSIFGDTQGTDTTPTSNNDSRELGEASVKAAQLLGIPSSGTTGGVDNGVTVVIFSGPSWVVNGTNATLNANAQALVTTALNNLSSNPGNDFSLSVSPGSASVTAGQSASATVSTAVTAGNPESVTLSASG
ncbi:MAG TPA: glycoside hydrolase family 75 protein, partial [Streptosporangiaceae bacterium]|nr:glycoside hydrolase family 75 protein [Streptosporangiaceae bacterium]